MEVIKVWLSGCSGWSNGWIHTPLVGGGGWMGTEGGGFLGGMRWKAGVDGFCCCQMPQPAGAGAAPDLTDLLLAGRGALLQKKCTEFPGHPCAVYAVTLVRDSDLLNEPKKVQQKRTIS